MISTCSKVFAISAIVVGVGACQISSNVDQKRPVTSNAILSTATTQLNSISFPRGPDKTSGAVLFINGMNSFQPVHQAGLPTPDLLRWFELFGFDVYRLDFSEADQRRFGNLIDIQLPRAVADLRIRGYKRLYVVGQSVGGVAAIFSIRRSAPLADGAIAFAPGINAKEPIVKQAEWHKQLMNEISVDRRIAVFHFKNDEILDGWHGAAVEISTASLRGRKDAMVRVPLNFEGHGSMAQSAFARLYGRCLALFLLSETPDGSICPQ